MQMIRETLANKSMDIQVIFSKSHEQWLSGKNEIKEMLQSEVDTQQKPLKYWFLEYEQQKPVASKLYNITD